jgi:hypothetical protein
MLFILLVLLFFILVLSFCYFLLPSSSVLIWEFLFDLKGTVFHLFVVYLIVRMEIS